MKTILLSTIISLFITGNGDSAKIVESNTKIENGKNLNLKFQFADEINITTWDKQEVYVKASVNINDNKDNDRFSFEVKEKDGSVSIESVISNMNEFKHNSLTTELNFEVKIPNNISLNLSTISGNIIVKGFDKEMDISTISGFVDITIPETTKANLGAKTISGEIFTNHEFDKKDENYDHVKVGQKVDASINGGGAEIDLKSISGNIYIRK